MMADRRRWSPESSERRKRDHKPSRYDKQAQYDEPDRMRSGAASPSSSTSSSLLDISHIYPYKTGLRTFFTAPSERRRLRKRRSNRSLGGHSSSSSLNLDLAYGTGYIRRPKRREVRSRKGKEIDREKNRDARRERDSNHQPTDAEILAVGAGLAKLARDQNKHDLKSSRTGKRAELVAVREPAGHRGQESGRGLGASKISHGSDTVDEDGWESASDDGSTSSVDSRLAFGDESSGWFGWGRPKPPPPSRKTSVVDPRFFGPANSLHGIVTEAVGFHEVTWDPSADQGKDNPFPTPRLETPPSGSQSSLQRVYPVATSDPSRFEAARSSVVSGSEPYVSSKHGELPLQQPQPYSPVSKNVFDPKYSAASESGASKKSAHSRSKSLAEAALAGVAVATAGAAIAAERRDERSDRRRDSDRRDPRDDRRREKRQSPDREERREKRREKERRRDDAPNGEKRRERRYDDPRYDDREDRRQNRRDDRPETRYDDPYYGGQSSSTRVPVDPFQYQVADDAFETPKSESPILRKIENATPTVVVVEREPDFSRFMGSSSRVESKDPPHQDDREQSYRGRDSREKELNDPEPASQETGRSTVAVAAIGAAVAAASAERARKAIERRRDRGDDYDRREKDSTKEPEPKSKPAKDPVQEEADRAYREIVMARKIASQVIRSRTPSPNRSVVEKYEEEDEPEEIIRIVTPSGVDEEEEKEKKKGPYDAPNADFKLDLVLEDPRHLRHGSLPRIDFETEGPSLKLDPDASKPRPFLNLVRPTPTPSPAPEKQIAESESKEAPTSAEREVPASTTPEREVPASATSDVVESNYAVPSSASSATSKGVTWGENDTKHYVVESPYEHKDEFVSSSEVRDVVKEVEQPKPTRPTTKRSGWGAVVAGITGAGIGAAAATASEASKSSKSKNGDDKRGEKPMFDEPRGTRSESFTVEPSQIPGAFNDDLDFTATVAAGLQDTGFDPNIVINDASFRRRESPPGSNEPRRDDRGDSTRDVGSYGSRDLVEEPETYFEPAKLSKKEQRRREKAAQRQESQSEEAAEVDQPIVADELVEEPDSYSSSSKKKSKKSKRDSANFDDTEEAPRQSRRISIPVDAFEDLRKGEDEWEEPKQSKSKKKSKRDSETYDSPTRSAPSEVASEFDTPSGKKSKSKSKRKSGSYDTDPDPADISLPPSEPSEVSRDGAESESRRSRRSSRRDDDERGESRSVASAEEESRKSRKKSRSGTKDEFDDTRSVISAPVEDEVEYSKSRKKEKRSSGGGFFGIFGSKSDVGTEEHSPKALKDDFEVDTRKKSKKSKRQSLQDEPAVVADSFDEQHRSSANGHSRSNGSRNGDDGDDYTPRADGESKKSQSKNESASAESDSFLDNAGILGAGAGLAGVAIALAAQHHQQSKADLEKSGRAIESTHSGRSLPSQQYDTIVDPEIVQRQFRPSIDPQYGDLLPLPPSGPTSPSLESFGELPELPDSRPDTPEAERFPRERGMSSARKSLQDAPAKSPSQSAVPLKFIMGNRSVPASPGIARSSPLQSPITQQESLASPRNRPRPTSWDSTKEYKPLYLVETNRRNSVVQHNESEESLPELPPSQRTSRSGSEVDFHDAVSDLGPNESSDELDHSARPLFIDTQLPSTEARSELLDSQQSTPKAGMQPQDIDSTRRVEQDPDSEALPSLPPSSSLLLTSGGEATPLENEQTGVESTAAAAVASSLDYFPSSPSHRLTDQTWLNNLISSTPTQPSPVEPMTKDRSSYLLKSSPLSKKAEDEVTFDSNLDSSTSRRLFSDADGDSLQSIVEGKAEEVLEIKDAQSAAGDEVLPEVPQDQPADVSRNPAEDNTQGTAGETEPELPVTSNTDAEPADEFFMASNKKSKKDKKKAKQLVRSATSDDIPVPEPGPSQETPQDDSTVADADSVEPSSGKSKKSKKKDKKAKSASQDWEPQGEESTPQTSANPLPEASQEPFDDPSAADNFATVKTKGKKKKSKSFVTWEEIPEESATPSWIDPEQTQESSREIVEATVKPEDSKPATESFDDSAQSGMSQDMLKGLGIWGASSIIENKKEDSTSVAWDVGDSAADEALSRDVPAEEDIIEATAIPDTEETGRVGRDTDMPPLSTAQEPDADNEFFMTSSKKSKKKGKKSRTEKLNEDSSLDTATSTDRSNSHVDAAEVSRPANVMEDFFEQVSRSGSKKGKKKSKKSKASNEEVDSQEDGAKEPLIEDLETTKAATLHDDPTSAKETYFPSASILHSPKKSSDSVSGGYFPSATAVLPIAAAGAALVSSSFLEKSENQYTPETIQPGDSPSKPVETDVDQITLPEVDSNPTAPDGLKAGYDNEQLSLARQLQEEFGTGSKKSKKDKKKRQSLPATSDREISRSRATEEESDIQPRARSLSVEPAPTVDTTEETPAGDKPKAIYGEDQLELARQLKAEFEAGNKKSKKDKKKRPGLSRSATFDEEALDSTPEPSPSLPAEAVTEPANLEDSAKGDGFTAGYQEDQLSLARQLQAEFGSGSKKSKKDKKGKKRESISQTPTLESENASDYFGDAAQASGSDFLQNDDPIESLESSSRDGLAVGYSAEQLELARQLKEEFGSKSSKKDKKDKKEKKRKSLLRNTSEDPEESQPQPDADPETSNLEVAEAASIEPTTADPDDEFTFTTKKKGKKSKKRDSLLPKSDIKDDEKAPAEDSIVQELEPVPGDIAESPKSADPEDEFAPVSKKGKKGKKGKKQDIGIEPDDKDLALESVSDDKDVELGIDSPAKTEAIEPAAGDLAEEFAFVSKKSKKGKKGKKEESTFDSEDKEPVPEPLSADRDMEPDVTPSPETNEPAADDEFAFVSKKSKKGKKGKKRVDTWDEDASQETAPLEGDVQPDSGVADKENPEPAVDNLAPAEMEPTAEEANKDESLETRRELLEERSEQLSFEDQVRALHDASALPSADPEAGVGEDPSEAPIDEFFSTTKRSKKGKKKQLSPPAEDPVESPVTPLDLQLEQVVEATADSKVPETGSPSRDVEPPFNSTEPIAEPDNTFEDFGFSTKKSKKDKKKRKSLLTAALEEEPEPSLSNPATVPAESSEPQPPSLDDTAQSEPAAGDAAAAESFEDSGAKDLSSASVQEPVEEPTDEWPGVSTKKSKKDKKKRKSGISTPAEETPSTIEDKPSVAEAVKEFVSEPTTADENISAAISSQMEHPFEQADEWSSLSMKKSKKDKKTRKSGLSTPSEDVPASTEEKPREGLEESEFAPTSVDETPTSIPEPAEEATDEWGSFSTKKSKKDKKKRKSGLSTPLEETPVPTEEDKPREVDGLEEPVPAQALVDDSLAAATLSQNDPVSEPIDDANDEWSSFSTKKSKKDRKKRKSGLSTPAEESISLVEEQKPLIAEESAEYQPEPLAVGDDIPAPKAIEDDAPKEQILVNEPSAETFEFTTKKSKKDKKKSKNSSLSIAADDALTTEDTVDASPETQPEQSQPVSIESERGLPDLQEDNAGSRELSDQVVEDDFGFSTKKSKKSKKTKRESRNELASLTEPSATIFEKQSPSTLEQSGDNGRSSQEESQARETPMLEPMPELTPTEAQGRAMDQMETKSEHSDLVSSSNEWTLKHDKRKRQATVDATINDDLSTPQPISWADEVEEAEIERQLPVIEEIAKDESLSHIATTTHVDDFSRPAKKGKKGKKGKKIDLAEFTPTGDSSHDPTESSSFKEEAMQENSKIPVALAAAGAILGGAALLGKSDKPKTTTFDEELNDSRDVTQPREAFEPIPEPESETVTPLNTKRYSHPGSSTLPAVEEESPDPMPPRPPYVEDIDDANRDSAFVTESPVPRHRNFSDDLEYNRDSGVHLRESSPYDKARATAATDDALARMSWPAIDEESETVDLHRSQRRKAEVYAKPHYDAEEIPAKERSLADDDKDTSSSQRRRHEEDDSAVHHLLGHNHRLSPAQLHKEEPPSKHIRLDSPKHDDDISVGRRDVHADAREDLPSQRDHTPKPSGLHRSPAVHMPSKLKEESIVRQRVQRIESPDSTRSQRPPDKKYGDLNTARRSEAEKPSSNYSSPTASGLGITGAGLGFAASRIASQEHRGVHNQSPGTSPRSLSNINRLRSPDPKTPVRPDSRGSNPSSVTPPLRRSDRKSGDLRSLSQRSKPDLAKDVEAAALTSPSTTSVNTASANPTANEGRVRAKEMADVYDGFGEGRMGSPRSPTRPHSMRRRQSMQVLDLESRLEQLAAENRQLAEARAQAEQALQATQHSSATLVERDAEIESLKRTLDWLQNEVTRLTEVNDGLNSANITLGNQHNERYSMLESQHAQTSRELEDVRESHSNLMAGAGSMEDKDREIAQLRADLEAAQDRIREMQVEILASKADDSHFLVVRDEDYFDSACQKLCQHVQQWVLRFSKFSDMRACRLTSEINNDKTIDRLDNAILDGSDVDSYLSDRVKRRDVFMSMTMTMVWEFVFTRYLFGMDREQRQKLKSLEKQLSEVGPASAVHQWRATTLTLLAKRDAFVQQREQDTLAVVHAVMETLSEILPPPSHLEQQIQDQLVRVIKAAVDLSIEMRTQRAEYMMLPPLQPEYDANGDLASKVNFNAALMNERSGDTVSNEELEESGAVVKIVLFPLVVKKGDDSGEGDEEIVVCPAQVLVAKPKKSARVFSPESVANQSRVSMQSTMPADPQWERVDM